MREIKFKLYDKRTGLTGDIVWINFANHSCGFLVMTSHSGKKIAERNINNVEIMQYTGEKDKNGVEIYEGDLICFGENKNPAEVRYCVETGSYVLFFKDGSTVDLSNREYAYKVIGNIYENEELLK